LENLANVTLCFPGRELFYPERSLAPEERLEKEAASGIKKQVNQKPGSLKRQSYLKTLAGIILAFWSA
jgi:hypothetical protein